MFFIEPLPLFASRKLCSACSRKETLTDYYVLSSPENLIHSSISGCVAKVYRKQDDQVKNFLKNIHIFSSLFDHELKKIYLQFQQKEFNKNHIIYKQGQKPEFIYFVKEGEVEVMITHCRSFLNELLFVSSCQLKSI